VLALTAIAFCGVSIMRQESAKPITRRLAASWTGQPGQLAQAAQHNKATADRLELIGLERGAAAPERSTFATSRTAHHCSRLRAVSIIVPN